MSWLMITGSVVSVAGLAAFYYLMVLRKGSPQKLLGEAFRMPDTRLHYAPEVLYKTFEDAGENGRPEMRRYWTLDFGLMACLTGVMIAVTANVAGKGTWIYPLMIAIAFARTAADLLEDLLFLSLLRRYPERRDTTARLACVVTILKHALLAVWLLLLFFLLLLSAFHINQ